ncbi:alpha/beta fold hydrolase [Haloglomus litoreum]|uniref:alpha/beta fold hydrolase n=1 Tax=Haloglomus litoreum TaxID=3034026 RepID=UPI0023E79194|nr:alpha/beta hydrolase [Haloglomus sp. DT116]
MTTFVLVHGSFHDGSAWEPVVRQLEQMGHTAYAPTVAGHGPDGNKDVTHADCSGSVEDYIVDRELEDIVLLGHSFGGSIIPKVAERIPDRITRLVFHNAFVVEDGNCVLDECPPPIQELFRALADESPDGSFTVPFPVWRDGFINDADIDVARSTYEELSPTPFQPFVDELDMSAFHSLELPSSYLYATEDGTLPQTDEWSWHPHMSSRLGLFRLVKMPGSHEVVFTNPQGLAAKIVEAGRE